MTGQGSRQLIFLDVDGPLIPFGGPPHEYPVHQTDTRSANQNPLLVRIDAGHGPRLAALPGQLVWAANRPFVWIDDEIGQPDRNWVSAHHPAPALLHRVDAATA